MRVEHLVELAISDDLFKRGVHTRLLPIPIQKLRYDREVEAALNRELDDVGESKWV